MGTFTVYGAYGSDDPTPEQGRVTIVPSVLPLVSTVDNTVVASPIIYKVDKGVVRVEGLPAKDDYQPAFSLTWIVKLNSGFVDTFEFMPEAAGVEVPLSQLQTVPAPLPPGGELQFALDVLAARDAATAARDQALQIAAQLGTINEQAVQVLVDKTELEVLLELEPPVDLTVLYNNVKA